MAKKSLLLSLSLGLLCFGASLETRGLRPHASRTEYSVTCFTEDIGVGATLESPDQVRRLFGGEVDRNYVVVEIGFYSKNHGSFDVRHADFALRNRPSRTLVKPAEMKDLRKIESSVRGLVALAQESGLTAVELYQFIETQWKDVEARTKSK